MRMRHFMAVCLASLAVSNSVPQSLSACEQCRGGHVCSSCQPSDDRGLLDRLDALLIRRRPRLSPVSIACLPALDGRLCRTVATRAVCRCGTGPNCGCELNEPTCGCELSEPTCGCELHQAGPYHTLGHANSGLATSPRPVPRAERQDEPYWEESYSAPPHLSNPPAAGRNRYQPDAPVPQPVAPQPVAPLPRHQPTETVPRPDSEVDPFRDESTGRVRRIPARAVQLTPSHRDDRQSYDAQARHKPVHMSLTDDAIIGQPQMSLGMNHTQRQTLDANGSSRHRAAESMRAAPERLPEVVSASGQRTLVNGRLSSDVEQDSGNNTARQPAQTQAAGFGNPLR